MCQRRTTSSRHTRRTCEPEVHEFGAAPCQHDVARFQIAVHNAGTVRALERICDLRANTQHIGRRHCALFETMRERLAFQGGTLQGAYLILAARALGLDCGPMGGFDRARVDAAFFPDGRWKSNFLVNLGYGDAAALRPRAPRLDFDDACRIE